MIIEESSSSKVYRKSGQQEAAEIKAIGRTTKEIGKMIKSSKKEFVWIFKIKEVEHALRVEASKISGKRRLYFNDNLVTKVTKPPNQKNFSLSFELTSRVKFEVREDGKITELYINGASFSAIMREGSSSVIRVQDRQSLAPRQLFRRPERGCSPPRPLPSVRSRLTRTDRALQSQSPDKRALRGEQEARLPHTTGDRKEAAGLLTLGKYLRLLRDGKLKGDAGLGGSQLGRGEGERRPGREASDDSPSDDADEAGDACEDAPATASELAALNSFVKDFFKSKDMVYFSNQSPNLCREANRLEVFLTILDLHQE